MNAHSHITAASAIATEPRSDQCPILPLAQEIAVVRSSIRKIETTIAREIGPQDTDLVTYSEKRRMELEDQQRHLRDGISLVKAESLEGAAVQIAAAIAVEDMMVDAIPPSDSDPWLASDHRAMQRLLFSVLEALERHCGRTVAEIVDASFAEPYTNPWLAPSERLAAIRDNRDRG